METEENNYGDFKIQPIFKDYIWGGQRLREDFGFQSDLPKTGRGLGCLPATRRV